MITIPEQHRKKAAWVAIAAAMITGEEGMRTVAYRDPVGIPTACVGETLGITAADVGKTKFTEEECLDKLDNRLVTDFGPGVDKCIHHPLPVYRKVAYTSFAYNVGIKAFCNSTLAKKENAGDIVGACNELPKWTTAHGITLPGLVKRREEERQMCMRSLS